MSRLRRILGFLILMVMLVIPCLTLAGNTINIPILCYHNLNPTIPGSMSMTPEKFESQVKWLKDNGFSIIPLKEAVEFLQGKRFSLPKKAIVVTVDDGWQSVYTYMQSIVKKYNIPVTLFIYPQTISTGKNAMSWDELKELQKTGLFDVQSHTYGHPNFKHAKRRLSSAGYEKFVKKELIKSRQILEEKMNKKIQYLAWPFGIYNDYLERQAADAGYEMAFTIDARPANRSFKPMAQPRYMIIDKQSMNTFRAIASQANS